MDAISARPELAGAARCLGAGFAAHDTAVVRTVATALGVPVPSSSTTQDYECVNDPSMISAGQLPALAIVLRGIDRHDTSADVSFGLHRDGSIYVGGEVQLSKERGEWLAHHVALIAM